MVTSTLSLWISSLIYSYRFAMKLAPIFLCHLSKTPQPIALIISMNGDVDVTSSSLRLMMSC